MMALCSIAIAAGIVGVALVLKKLVFRRRLGWGGGCGRGHGRWGGGFRGPGGSFWLRALFRRLDTTPGQEREIRAAIEDFQTTAKAAKDGVKASRAEVARAISGETFDEIALGEASGKVDTATTQIKDAFTSALKRIHAILDPKQRERLAELVSKGFGDFRNGGWRGPWNGPYRTAE
jgi:Spy/CpxP family protein refolding chaperone